MQETLQFVLHYGYALLFLWVLIEQGGLPIPATPLLLALGALAGQGRMNLALVLFSATLACVAADAFWYFFGKRRGAVVLNLLCRIAMEPDSCVRRTESKFSKSARDAPQSAVCSRAEYCRSGFGWHGPRSLRPVRCVRRGGGLLWSLAWALLGFVFSKQLDRIAAEAHLLGGGFLILFAIGVVAYVCIAGAIARGFWSK